MSGSADRLDQGTHERIFHDEVLTRNRVDELVSHEKPTAITLGGQPGAGKGGLERTARTELHDDVVTIDPDALRQYHPGFRQFRAVDRA